jgi:hypothetical protein
MAGRGLFNKLTESINAVADEARKQMAKGAPGQTPAGDTAAQSHAEGAQRMAADSGRAEDVRPGENLLDGSHQATPPGQPGAAPGAAAGVGQMIGAVGRLFGASAGPTAPNTRRPFDTDTAQAAAAGMQGGAGAAGMQGAAQMQGAAAADMEGARATADSAVCVHCRTPGQSGAFCTTCGGSLNR